MFNRQNVPKFSSPNTPIQKSGTQVIQQSRLSKGNLSRKVINFLDDEYDEVKGNKTTNSQSQFDLFQRDEVSLDSIYGLRNSLGSNPQNSKTIQIVPSPVLQKKDYSNGPSFKTPTANIFYPQSVQTNKEQSSKINQINYVINPQQFTLLKSKNQKLDHKHLIKCISNSISIDEKLTKEQLRIIWIKFEKKQINSSQNNAFGVIQSLQNQNEAPLSKSACLSQNSSLWSLKINTKNPFQYQSCNKYKIPANQSLSQNKLSPFGGGKQMQLFGSVKNQNKKIGVNLGLLEHSNSLINLSNKNQPKNTVQDVNIQQKKDSTNKSFTPISQTLVKPIQVHEVQNTISEQNQKQQDEIPLEPYVQQKFIDNFQTEIYPDYLLPYQIIKPATQSLSSLKNTQCKPASQPTVKKQQLLNTELKRTQVASLDEMLIKQSSDPISFEELNKSLQGLDPKLQILLPQFLFLLKNTQEMADQITKLIIQSNKSKNKQRSQINSFSLPLIGQYSIFPPLQEIETMKQAELKNVKGVRIWNQYGELYFLEGISLIGLDLDQCLVISQDNIQILNHDLQSKKVRMTFRDFGRFTILKGEEQRGAMLRRIRRWMAKHKMRQVSHDKLTGDLLVEVN